MSVPLKNDSVIEIYLSPKSKRKVWDASSDSWLPFKTPFSPPEPKTKKQHVYFPRESVLESYASFSLVPPVSEAPSASILSVNTPDEILSINVNEIPIFVCIRNKNKFVRWTYAILICHFLLILALLLLTRFYHPICDFFQENWLILFVIFIMIYLALEVMLVFSIKLRRYFPSNCVVFLLLTFCVGITLVSSHAPLNIIWSAIYGISLTVVVLFTIILLSCQHKWDVTSNCLHVFTFFYVAFITGMVVIGLNFIDFTEYDLLFLLLTSALMQLLIMWLLYMTRQIAICEEERLLLQEYIYGAITLAIHLPLFPMSIIKFIKYCRKL
ncbi:uncharacterized protein LOC123012686 [Tribolium madens]|uniref:uncharacterized protein LOC123012686 n=1 Tax=Tribolium madens TaxID=41895 RepID=UPI001CF74CA7|nr:uncharacterized protein LOC123012686 [Tribolium madens]